MVDLAERFEKLNVNIRLIGILVEETDLRGIVQYQATDIADIDALQIAGGTAETIQALAKTFLALDGGQPG